MTDAEQALAESVYEITINAQGYRDTSFDALLQAIDAMDDRIDNAHKRLIPLYEECCIELGLDIAEWRPKLAEIFRLIADRCQVWEVTDWLDIEADLADPGE